MRTLGTVAALLGAAAITAIPFLSLVGLAVHRHAATWVVFAAAVLLLYVPPAAAAAASRRDRPWMLALSLVAWSSALYFVLPVYFPGERRAAVATGLALFGVGGADRFAASLPDEPAMATPEVAEALPVVVDAPPPPAPVGDHQIALPYEGEGRRLTVPILLQHRGVELEVDMMLDTGATYTTLSNSVLQRLGLATDDDDPVLTLHTANGDREAAIVLLDEVWLGDLPIPGVAIAACDACASNDSVGLLGLNVAGGFNLQIDADRREVTFSQRARFDRKLDIKPFSTLGATFSRFPGGRVEVASTFDNLATRDVLGAAVTVRCGASEWAIQIGRVAAGTSDTTTRRLPVHEPCEPYEIVLAEALW